MTTRYLEYLERYPARPRPTTLRHLAAALRTTPAVEKLMPARCRRLIAPGGVGRFAFVTSTGPVVLLVNFAFVDATIVVRAAEGTVIDGHGDGPVGFEVDHIGDALGQGWSVLVRGQAHHVRDPAELNRMRQDATVWPWPGGEREMYLRIVPDRITGRRAEAR